MKNTSEHGVIKNGAAEAGRERNYNVSLQLYEYPPSTQTNENLSYKTSAYCSCSDLSQKTSDSSGFSIQSNSTTPDYVGFENSISKSTKLNSTSLKFPVEKNEGFVMSISCSKYPPILQRKEDETISDKQCHNTKI